MCLWECIVMNDRKQIFDRPAVAKASMQAAVWLNH